ncbi:MAG TPA: alpha/beta hydrolase [Stellaceae bacterium]|jgi:pimeloyl-ACP methyl ester carboxylesterase|nr:alpha/beta hydrolase [Stellaceae bacterium]
MLHEIRSRYVMANGVRTHYWESGNGGPTVIALHGGGAGSSGMAGMGPLLERLGGDARVIAPDSVGGFGLTDPYAPVPYGLMSRVQHLADFMDALCLDKVAMVGNSQGAWTGAQYAILHPDRVEKMVLISSLTIANSLNIPQRPTDALKALNDYDGTREGMRRILQALIIDPKRITDKLIDDRQAAAMRPGALDAFKAFGRGTASLRQNALFALQNDMTRSLPVMVKTIPTIFIWGDSDTFALPETGKKIGEFVPEAKFHWVPGAGHQVQTDKPDEAAAIIREFFGYK